VSVNPLHRARLGNGISLSEVTARTCLSPRIVQLIDVGQFDRLPGGIYARSYVRSFAAVVGLDPESVVAELSQQLPPNEDPLPALRESTRAYLPPWVRDVLKLTQAVKAKGASRVAQLRSSPFRAAHQWRRVAAAGVDIGLLLLCYAGLIRLTVWIATTDLRTGIEVAGLPVAVLCSLVGFLYFGLLGGIGGRTLGALLCGLPATSAGAPLGLRDIWLRTRSRWTRNAPGISARC
jgi:hypothetical protein